MDRNIDLMQDFAQELTQIGNRLRQLETGKIYELTGVRSDGTLNTNICKLKEELCDLFLKIEGKRPSFQEEMQRYF